MAAFAEIRALFDPSPGTVYLDAATYGLPPRATVAAMHQAIDGWQSGAADWVTAWDMRGEACRASFGELIGASAEAIALIPSVSVGVATVAAVLQPGDEVVAPDDEFTSVLFPLLVAARERGAIVREVPLEHLAAGIGSRTRLVAFSLIQSQSGRAADLAAIVDSANRVGAQTLVDATHAVPFVPLQAGRVDYLVCAAYKHLLSPRGVAFLYVAQNHWEHIPPLLANWRSTSRLYGHYYGGELDVAPNAARFDVSLAWFSWAGAAVSLALLADWQQQGLLQHPLDLARRLAGHLDLAEPVGTLVSVPVDNAEGVRQDLAAAGFKAAVRAGSVRLSPHVYNTIEEIDRAAETLARFALQPAPR
ncbi:MAG: aminotransferase class V-fold PLP-dependent enzyme [Chloroflexi bacterium]|nr:aminotransferase class V-fold PLP-dependent enzyme [Chloroflexota bacterium]